MAPRTEKTRLKEPIYNFEAQYLCYNPNLIRNAMPETPGDHFRRHAEELFSIAPYLECLEKRQEKAWSDFEQRGFGTPNISGGVTLALADLRDNWNQQEA